MAEEEDKPERRFPIGKLVAVPVLLTVVWGIGFVGYRVIGVQVTGPMARRAKVEWDLTQLLFAAEAFCRSTGRYPASIDEMVGVLDSSDRSGAASRCRVALDPWGTQYGYQIANGKPEVRCLGPDREADGGDDVIKTLDDLGPLQDGERNIPP
jgi:hypothetical protein